MGYRSDVRILTTKKGFEELKKNADNLLKEDNWKYGNLIDEKCIIHENDNYKYFGWDSIKWYDNCEGYENVTAIMKGLDKLQEQDFSYRFARIGENYDDYEEFSYESEREEEQDLDYPCFVRYFDDDYLIDNIKKHENDMEIGGER